MADETLLPYRLARLVSALALVSCLAVPLGLVAMPRGARVLVIAPPGSQLVAVLGIIAAADGRVVSATRLDWAVVAESAEANFASRLRAAGAMLVLEGWGFDGCAAASRKGVTSA